MEPTEMNSTPADDPQLEAWMRQNAALSPLPDDGFTARVLHALPRPAAGVLRTLDEAAREQVADARRRFGFCAAGAAAGVAVCGLGFDSPAALAATWDTLGGLPFTPAQTLAAAGAAIVTLASLAVAFWPQLNALRRTHA